jgi:hypothetical protein
MAGLGRIALCAGFAGLLVFAGGCHRNPAQRRPAPALRLERDAAASKSSAPATPVLPAAEAVEVGPPPDPQGAYELLDDAYYMGDAFGDAPPDYAVMANDVQLWVWRSAGDAMQVVEPVDDGYRLYYYTPGSASPFLVRDGGQAYAFDGPRLAAAYDADDRLFTNAELAEHSDEAGRLLQRGKDVRQAALHSPIRSVPAAGWAQALPALSQARSQWEATLREQEEWRTQDMAYTVRQTDYWKAEKARRGRAAERFEGWRAKGFRGRPPAPVEGADRKSEQIKEAGLPAPREAEAR